MERSSASPLPQDQEHSTGELVKILGCPGRQWPWRLLHAPAARQGLGQATNMAGLAFIDGSCARMIVDAARGLAASRSVVLQCHPGIIATFALLGADDVPGISLVSVPDR